MRRKSSKSTLARHSSKQSAFSRAFFCSSESINGKQARNNRRWERTHAEKLQLMVDDTKYAQQTQEKLPRIVRKVQKKRRVSHFRSECPFSKSKVVFRAPLAGRRPSTWSKLCETSGRNGRPVGGVNGRAAGMTESGRRRKKKGGRRRPVPISVSADEIRIPPLGGGHFCCGNAVDTSPFKEILVHVRPMNQKTLKDLNTRLMVICWFTASAIGYFLTLVCSIDQKIHQTPLNTHLVIP